MGVKNAPRLHVAGPALIHAGVRDYAARRRRELLVHVRHAGLSEAPPRRGDAHTPQTPTEAEDLANIDTVLDGDSDSLKRDLRIHFEEYKEGHPTAL